MSQKYLDKCLKQIQNKKNIDLDNFFRNIDYKKLSLDDITEIITIINTITINEDTLIYIIDNISSKIKKFSDISTYEIYELYYNDKIDNRKVIKYFIDKEDYNNIVIDMLFYNVDLFVELEGMFDDKLIKKLAKTIDKNRDDNNISEFLEDLYIHLKDEKQLFNNRFVDYLFKNHKKMLDDIFNINDLDVESIVIFELHDYLYKNKIDDIFDKMFKKLDPSTVSYYIYDYINNVDVNRLYREIDNIDYFIKRIEKYLDSNKDDPDYEEELRSSLNILKIAKFNHLKDINIFIEDFDNDTSEIAIKEKISIIQNLDGIDTENKIMLISITLLELLKNRELNRISINNLLYGGKAYVIATAAIYSKKFIENIDNMDKLSDKSRYILKKGIKNIDKDLYRYLLEKSINHINGIRNCISTIDR